MRRYWQLFSWFYKIHRKKYIIGISAVVVLNLMMLFRPMITGYIVDNVMNNTLSVTAMWVITGALLLSAVLSGFLEYIHGVNIFHGESQSEQLIRRKIVGKIVRQSPTFFATNSTGSIMAKATNDVTAASESTGFGVLAAFDSHVFTLGCLIALLLTNSWHLTLVSLLPMPIFVMLLTKTEKKLAYIYNEMQNSFDAMSERVLEDVSGIRVVRAYAAEKTATHNFSLAATDLYDKTMHVTVVQTMFPLLGKMMPSMSLILALGYGSYLISQNVLTIGQLIAFTMYVNIIVWPMFALGEYFTVRREAIESMVRINELLDYAEDVVDKSDAIDYTGTGSMEFRHVDFKYPQAETMALRDISFVLEQGQTLGIVGPVGSGKTTLIKQMMRFYNIDSGQILYDGRLLEDYKVASICHHVGYVPQNHILFSKTIRENIEIGRGDNMDITVEDVIKMADFTKDLAQLEQGLETPVGEMGVALSGGQKQRIGIARALLRTPAILLLDDSLSAVDAKTEAKIIERLRQNRTDKTTVISTHRLSAVMHADLILVLKDGMIDVCGTHEELMNQKTWYRKQFEHQRLERIVTATDSLSDEEQDGRYNTKSIKPA